MFGLKKLSRLLCFSIMSWMLAVPAVAATIDQAGAQELKQFMSEMLEYQKGAITVNGLELETEGDVQVEMADGYYAVTMPHLMIRGTDGSSFDLGIVSVNAAPTDDDSIWKMSVALPTPMTGYDSDGTPAVIVEIAKQRMSGLWHKDFSNFVKLDAEYGDFAIRMPDNGDGLVIPSVKAVFNLEEDSDGLWSGSTDVYANGIKLTIEGNEVFSTDRISVKSNIMKLSSDAFKEYRESMLSFSKAMSGVQDEADVDPEVVANLYNQLFGFLTSGWDGFDTSVVIEGVDVEAGMNAQDPDQKVHIDKLGYGFDMGGFRTDDVNTSAKVWMTGLTVGASEMEGVEDIVPSDFKFDVTAEHIPLKQLAALGEKTLQTSIESPEQAQMSGMMMVQNIPQILAGAGTLLKISDVIIKNSGYEVGVKGTVNANASSPFGVTANIVCGIAGIDNLVAELTNRMHSGELEQTEMQAIQRELQFLAPIQMFGSQETDAQGRNMRVYKFSVNEQGQILLNGTDLSMMMGQMMMAPQMQQQ